MQTTKASLRRSLGWTLRAAQVRLRFLIALGVGFVIVARWDVLRTYWDRWTAPAARDASMGAVSADTEYFCPMDPGVLSDWPGKCPICHMALVRRLKGDMGPLPSGVVARVQLSPDRVLLAGIKVEPVRYRPLAREIRSVGPVKVDGNRASIPVEVGPDDSSWIEPGQTTEVAPDPPDGSPSIPGRVRSVDLASDGSASAYVEVEVSRPVARAPGRPLCLDRGPASGRPSRALPLDAARRSAAQARRASSVSDLPRPSRSPPGRGRPLPEGREAARTREPGQEPAPRLVVPHASEGRGRSGGLEVRRVRRDGAGAPGHLVLPDGRGSCRPRVGRDRHRRADGRLRRADARDVRDGVEVRLGPRVRGYLVRSSRALPRPARRWPPRGRRVPARRRDPPESGPRRRLLRGQAGRTSRPRSPSFLPKRLTLRRSAR